MAAAAADKIVLIAQTDEQVAKLGSRRDTGGEGLVFEGNGPRQRSFAGGVKWQPKEVEMVLMGKSSAIHSPAC
jgi:hypothetical protein